MSGSDEDHVPPRGEVTGALVPAPGPQSDGRIELAIGVTALAVLVIGCFLVLLPFLSSLAWGIVLAHACWPLFSRLRRLTGGWTTVAAAIMTLLLAMAFVLPLFLVGQQVADGVTQLIDIIRSVVVMGLPPLPEWITDLPIVGPAAESAWLDLTRNTSGKVEAIQPYLATARDLAIRLGLGVGSGMLEVTLSVVAAFFFFRDGESVIEVARAAGERITGDRIQHLMEVTGATIRGVVYGVIGTALAQAILAWISFTIVGLKGALVLAVVTFFLGLLPLGPPVVWVPIGIWLLAQGATGYGTFQLVWGLFVISGVDNFLRPYLLSQASDMSFLMGFLGVVGGGLAFGFLGIFLGPVLLAVGSVVLRDWATPSRPQVSQLGA